ncbi:MAG TPA: ABC transporter ATP-binding protein [Bacteroidota bacterium]|nr:ABC transporter ATP-binding protein [Bacteroidota bacterium]
MIRTVALTKMYENRRAVDHLSIDVQPGEILGFLGPNGAGKSTTVKMLTGMLTPSSGEAYVAGFDVFKEPLRVKERIGYIPESGAMYESLTPMEYLDFVSSLYHLKPDVAVARFNDLIEIFGIAQYRDQRISELSKGTRQKLLIASALIHRPEVLFLDEPLNGLDTNAALVVKELLRKLASQGKTIFFCSHILEVVERICTRIVIIDKGQQIITGTAGQIVRDTDASTLEEAFSKLTGVRTAEDLSDDVISALDRV